MNESEAERINKLKSEIADHVMQALEKAVDIGKLLCQQKAELASGAFIPWIHTQVKLKDETARTYMALYEYGDRVKTENVTDPNGIVRTCHQQIVKGEPRTEPSWMPWPGEIAVGPGEQYDDERWLCLVRTVRHPEYVQAYSLVGPIMDGTRHGIAVECVEGFLLSMNIDPDAGTTWMRGLLIDEEHFALAQLLHEVLNQKE